MDQKLVQLIDNGKFFGAGGAIALSKDILEASKPYEKTETKINEIMSHVNVLYSAVGHCSTGNIFMKMYGAYLAYMCDYFATLVLDQASKVDNLAKELGPGGCHILMSVWVRCLQILKILRLHDKLPSVRSQLYDKMIVSYNMIGILQNVESKSYVPKHPFDLGPAARLQLHGSGLLYELSKDGLYTYQKPYESADIKEMIWRYCMWHESHAQDRSSIQMVCRLYRTIGHHEMAATLASRVGTQDQIRKATVS